MDHLTGVRALEPGRAVALDRCTKVRNGPIDLGGARASAVGKPIGKASARGSYCLAGRPRQNTVGNSQFAGRRQQAKRARDPLHLAVCTGCVLLGKRIDEAPGLSKTCLAISNERLDEGRAGGAETRLCSIDEIARQRVAAILRRATIGLLGQLRRMIEKAKAGASIGCQINEADRLPGHVALGCAGISDLVGEADLARADQENAPLKARLRRGPM